MPENYESPEILQEDLLSTPFGVDVYHSTENGPIGGLTTSDMNLEPREYENE